MKRILFLALYLYFNWIHAQTFPIEKIKDAGDVNKRINLVILSEGYQTSELPKFITDATNFTDYMFGQSPFLEYADYFNVYALKVPSNESGADHPKTASDEGSYNIPAKTVDTYFNATYDAYGTHRLLYYGIDGPTAASSAIKINNVLATNFPLYDQALILVNSSYYGGTGGQFPMASNGASASEIIVHELGHSFANLKDEYYPLQEVYFSEATNMTQETNPALVKWKNWLGTDDIGIYQYHNSGYASNWYRPHQACKMRALGNPFCSVCKEGIIEKIHSLISPLDAYTPVSNSIQNPSFPLNFHLELIKPNSNTLESIWTLNSVVIENNMDDISILENALMEGENTLTVAINDNSPLLNVDSHATLHVYTVTWTINYSALGIDDLTSKINNFNITIYPNPSNDFISIKAENMLALDLKMDLISLDGKRVKEARLLNNQTQQIDISLLSDGIYVANFYANNIKVGSKKIIKN